MNEPGNRMLESPIGFAHRGGRAHGRDNSLECFAKAIEMGARGLETDVWLTRDGVAVLEHSGLVRAGLIPRPISWTTWESLPDHIPRLADLYELGTDFELSVDVKAGIAGAEAIAIATEAGAIDRLWLCHWDLKRLRAWRISSKDVRLVNSVRRLTIREGLAERARRLAAIGVNALNLRGPEWSPDAVDAVHAHGIFAFGWDAHDERSLERLISMGVDGVYSDDVPMMLSMTSSA